MKKISENVLNDMEKAGKQLLDDEELDLVSGGERCAFLWNDGRGCQTISNDTEDDLCFLDYCCYTVVMHPDDTSGGDSCLSDYNCFFINIHK